MAKTYNDGLGELDHAINVFFAVTSHKLLTPTTVMKWNLELVRKEMPNTNGKVNEYLSNIEEQIQKLINFGKYTMDIMSILTGDGIDNAKSKINFKILFDDLIERMSTDFTEFKNYKVSLKNLPDTEFFVHGDEMRLKEIFYSILRNAYVYKKPEVPLEIEVDYSDDNSKILIGIRDNGIGIDIAEAAKDMIFAPFFRTKKAFESSVSGFGLDLYLAKLYLTKASRGDIYFMSKENGWSEFIVSLSKINKQNV